MNKITAGLFFFMSVPPGKHDSYNRWLMYDDMPEFLTPPGQAGAQRYVATPEIIPLNSGDPAVAPAQYFVVYYIQGPVERAMQERVETNRRVAAEGRAFPGRRTIHFMGLFDYAGGHAAPRVKVSPEALPYRPHAGVYVTISGLQQPARAKEVEDWYKGVRFPDVLGLPGFAGVWRFVSRGDPSRAGGGVGGDPRGSGVRGAAEVEYPNPPDRFLQLYFLDDEPAIALAALRARALEWRKADRGPPEDPRTLIAASAFRTVPEGRYDWFDRGIAG